jgi:hypothetical protein
MNPTGLRSAPVALSTSSVALGRSDNLRSRDLNLLLVSGLLLGVRAGSERDVRAQANHQFVFDPLRRIVPVDDSGAGIDHIL